MEYALLNNGLKVPLVGFGVFEIPKEDTKRCVLDAISVGYRLIDTAQIYGNEEEVGQAIAESPVPREELFIVDKVWVNRMGYERTKYVIDDALDKLQLDYLDAMLIHEPYGDYYGSWRALEEAYEEGKLKSIGLSSFFPDRYVDLVGFNKVLPALNQVEAHVFDQQRELMGFMSRYGTVAMANSPLAKGANGMFTNETLTRIGARYGKTAAQIDLKFLVTKGIIVIPKTVSIERMKQNINLFDFNLTQEEIREIEAMDLDHSLFIDFHTAWASEHFVARGHAEEE